MSKRNRKNRRDRNPPPSTTISRSDPPAGQAGITSVTQSVSFTGPLPPPAVLARYNQVFPGCAERIVAMAERQSKHRQQLESTHLQGSLIIERRGQVSGLLLGLIAIVGGIGLIAFDKDAAGLTSIIAALVSLAGVFIYGRLSQTKERQRKRDEFREKQLPLPYGQQDQG